MHIEAIDGNLSRFRGYGHKGVHGIYFQRNEQGFPAQRFLPYDDIEYFVVDGVVVRDRLDNYQKAEVKDKSI